MAKHIKMTDGAHHIVVAEARVDFMKEKGFAVEGDAHLAPGQLVGHIRVRRRPRPTPPGHIKRDVEMTDGFQTITADANDVGTHAMFVRKGFIELPPLSPHPDVSGIEEVDEIVRAVRKWQRENAPTIANRERIKKEAAASGRYS